MALLSVPLVISIALSAGKQVLEEHFHNSLGNHATYSCEKEIDLRDRGFSMEGLPHLDQGDTNLCSQYTAAEMIDAWRILQVGRPLKPDERTSPMALAIEYAAKNDFPYSFPIQNSTDPFARKTGRWGGIVCVFANSAREIGVCSDRVLQETQGKSLEAIAKSEALFHALIDYQALKPKLKEEKRRKVSERIRTILTSLPPAMEPSNVPSVEEIYEELAFFTGEDPYVPMSRLLLRDCRKQRRAVVELPRCLTHFDAGLDAFGWSVPYVPFRGSQTFERVKSLLYREQPTPIALAYCHKVVHRGRGYRPNSILATGCGQHWSLVIGSRQKNGKCQFLIRDTDGGKPDRVSSDWEINRGDLWIDAETLMRSTYAIEYFE